MDRRQQKTRAAIFQAFSKLLETKRFRNITVQEIIDEANVGRSTFYAHFETKDALLKAMCSDIFHHVFSHELMSEKTHDFSQTSYGLKDKITHILYHLKDHENDICGILSCEDGELFMDYFKGYLRELFSHYISEFPIDAPLEFTVSCLVGGFTETVRQWIDHKMEYTPEEIAGYYMNVMRL